MFAGLGRIVGETFKAIKTMKALKPVSKITREATNSVDEVSKVGRDVWKVSTTVKKGMLNYRGATYRITFGESADGKRYVHAIDVLDSNGNWRSLTPTETWRTAKELAQNLKKDLGQLGKDIAESRGLPTNYIGTPPTTFHKPPPKYPPRYP